MTKDLLDIFTYVEENQNTHAARLLILISNFKNSDQTSIDGITKLAKLDFLLRYPLYFEKAMIARGVSPKAIEIPEYERETIESKMVRYKYGPWDHRYRGLLNVLAAKGLISITMQGRKVSIDITQSGEILSNKLIELPAFKSINSRSKLLKRHLDIKATNLMKFIYEQFPELNDMQLNTTINSRDLLK